MIYSAGLDASLRAWLRSIYHTIDEGAELRRRQSLDVFNRAKLFGNEIDSFHRSSRIYHEFYRPHHYNDVVEFMA